VIEPTEPAEEAVDLLAVGRVDAGGGGDPRQLVGGRAQPAFTTPSGTPRAVGMPEGIARFAAITRFGTALWTD